jgi:hypothetical protein
MAIKDLFIKKVYLLHFKGFQIKGPELKQLLKWFQNCHVFYYKEPIYHVLTALSFKRIRICMAPLAVKTETSANYQRS